MRAFYSIIQYCPDCFRSETVSVGLVLLCESTGKLKVDVIRDYDRLCTFFPQTELKNFEHSLFSIKSRIENSLDELQTVAGLKHFADTRANDFRLTDPRLAIIDDLDKDFERLFSKFAEWKNMTENYSEEAFGFCSKLDDSDKTELNAMTMMLIASLGRTFDFVKRECFYVKKPNKEFKNKNIDYINSLFKDITDHESGKHYAKDFLSDEFDLNMFHATLGLMTEVGEIFECLLNYNIATSIAKKNGTIISDEEKKQIRLNLIEELGDLEWYSNLARHSLNISQKEVQDINLAKLRERYKKSLEFGKERNLEDEKNAMIKEMEK